MMKKILPVLAAVMLLLSSAAAAESLPALPGEEPGLPAFATMNEDQIREGLTRLAALVRDELAACGGSGRTAP